MTSTIPMEAQCNNVLATKHTDSFSLPLAMSMWISHQSQLQNISVDNPWSQSFISFQTLYVIAGEWENADPWKEIQQAEIA